MLKGCSRNVVRGCRIHDAGGNGVFIGEYWRHYYDHYHEADIRPACVPTGNVIENCRIDHCGEQFYGAVGIGLAYTDGAVVRSNLVHDLPYTGLSVGFVWTTRPTVCRANVIERNHIHHVMLKMADGGGVYTLGYQPGTVFRRNLIHDVPRDEFARGAPNNGFFTDEGSKGFLFERNLVYRTAGAPVRHNDCRKEWHEWRDNVFGREPTEEEVARLGAGPEPEHANRPLGGG
jgi:hypothetical protein